jgi:hypothetical protein
MKRSWVYRYLLITCLILVASACSPAAPPSPEQADRGGVSTTPPEEASPIARKATETPAQEPVNAEVRFDSANANTSAPEDVQDVIEEVLFGGMGGGGGEGDPCEGISFPTIMSDWSDVEQMSPAWMTMCGWRGDSQISASLTRPDGTTRQDQLDVEGSQVYWSYFPTIEDPPGEYRIEFSDQQQFIGFKFDVNEVTDPGVYISFDDSTIQVYKFRPGEKVRLLKYKDDFDNQTLVLQAWEQFKTNSQGNVLIHLNDIAGEFVLLGEKSGEFPVTGGFGQSVLKGSAAEASNKSLCDGAPKSRVAVGSVARITFTDGTPTRVRKQPEASSKILGRLAEGVQFSLIDGPRCSDGFTWWRIQLANGTRGWVAEGNRSTYFIEPVDASQQTCSSMPARVQPGDKARVAHTNGSNMRIRNQPGFSQDVITKVPEGTPITILEGPQCVDGNNWWKVRAKGVEGWMTESQNGEYLIEP